MLLETQQQEQLKLGMVLYGVLDKQQGFTIYHPHYPYQNYYQKQMLLLAINYLQTYQE